MITIQDFKKIGLIAGNCDQSKLEIAINEAITFDFITAFGDCENNVKEVLSRVLTNGAFNESEKHFILGNKFENNGFYFDNIGVKNGLVYYAYARYIMLNGFNDTANGFVTKTNEFSIPKPLKELEAVATQYRNMAKFAMLSTLEWAALKINDLPTLQCLNLCDCKCFLGNDGKKSINTKGFGFVGGNIYKDKL